MRPDLFGTFTAFTTAFCDGHRGRFGDWDVSGASNLEALHVSLTQLMVRRLKRDVLTQLPAKRRTRVVVELPPKARAEMRELAQELSEARRRANGEGSDGEGSWEASMEHRSLLSAAYKATGEAKLGGVCDYVAQLIEGSSPATELPRSMGKAEKGNGKSGGGGGGGGDDDSSDANSGKILIFAHHLKVLDGLQSCCVRAKIGFIRIDGSVPSSTRHALVEQFQRDPAIRVAVLSLTAAGQGITLTSKNRWNSPFCAPDLCGT